MKTNAFSGYELDHLSGYSWRIYAPTIAPSFVIVWVNGYLVVMGENCHAIYVAPWDFRSMNSTVSKMIESSADYRYLTARSGFKLEYNHHKTIENIVADAEINICREWAWEEFGGLIHCGDHKKRYAKTINNQSIKSWIQENGAWSINQEMIVDIFGCSSLFCMEYPPASKLTFGAVKKWAQLMVAGDAPNMLGVEEK